MVTAALVNSRKSLMIERVEIRNSPPMTSFMPACSGCTVRMPVDNLVEPTSYGVSKPRSDARSAIRAPLVTRDDLGKPGDHIRQRSECGERVRDARVLLEAHVLPRRADAGDV